MKTMPRVVPALIVGVFTTLLAFGQTQQTEQLRRSPLPSDAASQASPNSRPSGKFVSILNGLPMLLELHRDTEVGTGKPIDVYMMVIEMQIMNSDGNLEPIGLQIDNFYTAKPQDPANDINPHNARDCKIWNNLVLRALQHHNPKSGIWPYIEFITAQGARIVQTNEDGPVWWSDDIECWGSADRFPPF